MSDFLLEQGKKTTINIFEELEPLKAKIKVSEYKALREMIIILIDEWIDENMKISHYKTLLTRDPDKKQILMIIDYLKNDIRDKVNSIFDKWSNELGDNNKFASVLSKIAKPFQGPIISYVLNHLKPIYNFFVKFFSTM